MNNNTIDDLLWAWGLSSKMSPLIESKAIGGSSRGPFKGRRFIFTFVQILQFISLFINPCKFGIPLVILKVLTSILKPGWPGR